MRNKHLCDRTGTESSHAVLRKQHDGTDGIALFEGGDNHSYMGRIVMRNRICIAHCRDYRLDDEQEKVAFD